MHRKRSSPCSRRASRRFAVITLLVVLPWVWLPAGALASPFRRLSSSVVAFSSDGTRYAAWQATASSPIVVLDAVRRKQVSYLGCTLAGARYDPPAEELASAGRFLVVCSEGFALIDAANGALTPLPKPAGIYDGEWVAVGARYAQATADPLDCPHSPAQASKGDTGEGPACSALYDIETGALSYRRESQVANLDRRGAPTICRALRAKLAREGRSVSFPGGFAFGEDLLAETVQRGEAPVRSIRIRGCQGSKVVPTVPEPRDLLLAGGLLTWDTGHAGEQYDAEATDSTEHIGSGRLWSYRVANGMRRSVALPLESTIVPPGRVRGVLGYSSHAGRTLFWIAARRVGVDEVSFVETSAVYVAWP